MIRNLNKIIFLHIPKTAGTTLNRILDREYRDEEIFFIDGKRMSESIKELVDLTSEEKEKIQLFRGHMAYGLHTYLPMPSVYVTILRHPLERIISHYYYVKRNPKHYLYKKVTSEQMDLADYVSSGLSTELDNGQTRLLAGVGGEIDFAQCSRELLDKAIYNIRRHFAVVGISERFDQTLVFMKKVFGWRTHLFYKKANVANNRPLLTDISERTLNVIEKHNELDLQLYEYAFRSFEEALESLGYRTKLTSKIFSTLNSVYKRYRPENSYQNRILRRVYGFIQK